MKLLISDFEGTLVDFQWKLKDSMSEMCKILKGYDINYNLKLPIKKLKNYNYAKLYNYFQKNIYDPNLKNKIISDFDRVYDFYDEDAAKRWNLKKEVPYFLKKLVEKDVKIALCSNVGRSALDYMLKKLQIKIFFDMTISRDDVNFLKPSIEGVKKILEKFKINKNEKHKIFFLGDSLTDIYTARKARIPSIIIVGEGENNLLEIMKKKPDHIIYNLKDVIDFFIT